MHANVHYAVGVIFASITNIFIPLNMFWYAFIVGSSFAVDFDFLLRRFTNEDNHRKFITHTLIFPLIMLVIGVIIALIYHFQIIWIGGLAYLSHIFLDTIDWGVSLFYRGKEYGFYKLITKEEAAEYNKNYELIIANLKSEDPHFFINRYYSNKLIVGIDIGISILGFIVALILTPQYLYFYAGFFVFLIYHMYYLRRARKN
ncbi:MAG: metal-dependent hydrolase [Promethearchaeota archaeon]